MTAESNIGARIVIIGQAAAMATLKELQGGIAGVNDTAVAGMEEQKVGYATLAEAQAAYRADLAVTTAAQTAANEKAATSFGKGAFLGLAAIMGVVTYEGIKNTTVLQKNLTLLQTQAGMTAKGMLAVKAAAMGIGTKLGATPESYAAAAYAPASTGMSPAETIAIVNNAQKEAIISGAGLTDTVNSLTGVMKSYNLSAGQAAKTQAQLNAIVGAGNMHFTDFNAAMSSGVAATSALYGVSIASLGAPLAYMTDRGVPAAQAATRLRMTEALMASPTAEAAKVGAAAGLSATDITGQTSGMQQALTLAGVNQTKLASDMRQPDGILVALKDLKTHMDAAGVSTDIQNAALSKMFGGGRSGSVAAALFANIPGGEAKYAQIMKGSTTGAFNSDFNKAMDTQSAKVKVLDSQWHAFSITLGSDMLPVVSALTGALSGVLGFLGRNHDALGALAGLITVTVGPAIGLYLTSKFLAVGGAMSKVIGFYTNLGRSLLAHIETMGTDATVTTVDTVAARGQSTALGTEDGMLVAQDASLAKNTDAWLTNDAAKGAKLFGSGGILSTLSDMGLTIPVVAATVGAAAVSTHVTNAVNKGVDRQKAAAAAAAKKANKPPPGAPGGLLGALTNWASDDAIRRQYHNVSSGLNLDHNIPQGVGDIGHVAASAWDDIAGWLGGGSKPAKSSMPAPGPAGPGGQSFVTHVDVYLSGKQIAAQVQASTRAQAARN
jgi:TP901 family phage tail tape measure protein